VLLQSVVVRLSEPGETADFVAEILAELHLREDVTLHRTGLPIVLHHGGKTANAAILYEWARPSTVIVSQRMATLEMNDVLITLERSGIPLLRTWQCGVVHF